MYCNHNYCLLIDCEFHSNLYSSSDRSAVSFHSHCSVIIVVVCYFCVELFSEVLILCT
jgi:hypothetical protein